MIPVSTEARQHYLSDQRGIGYSYFTVFRDLGVCKINSDILSESLEITESICSAGKFKVGLCEAATAGITVNMPENTEGDEVTIFQAQGDFQPQIDVDPVKGLQFSGDGITELYSGAIDPTAEVIIGTEQATFEAGKYYLALLRLWYVGDEIYIYVKSDDEITRMVYYYLPQQQDLTHLKNYSASTTYNKGAKVRYNSKVYKSAINGNTATPGSGDEWQDITAYIQIALPMIGEEFESFHRCLYNNHYDDTGLNGYATLYEIAYPLMPLGLFTIASSKRHEDRQLRDIRGYDRMNSAKLSDDINIDNAEGDSLYISDVLDYAANGTQIIVGSNLAQNPVTVETEGQTSTEIDLGRVYHSYAHEVKEGVKGTFVPQPTPREACYILYIDWDHVHLWLEDDPQYAREYAQEIYDSWPLEMKRTMSFSTFYNNICHKDQTAFETYHRNYEWSYEGVLLTDAKTRDVNNTIYIKTDRTTLYPSNIRRLPRNYSMPEKETDKTRIYFEYIPTSYYDDDFSSAEQALLKVYGDIGVEWRITDWQRIYHDFPTGSDIDRFAPHIILEAAVYMTNEAEQEVNPGDEDLKAEFLWNTDITRKNTLHDNGADIEQLDRIQINRGYAGPAPRRWDIWHREYKDKYEDFFKTAHIEYFVEYCGIFEYNEPKGKGWVVTAEAFNKQDKYDQGKITYLELLQGGKTRTYERDINIDWRETLVKTAARFGISNYVIREDMVYFVKIHSPETQGAYRAENDVIKAQALENGELTVDEQARAQAAILNNSTPAGEVVIDENGHFTVEYISQIKYSAYDGYDTTSTALGFENPYYGVTYHSKDELFNDLQIIVGNAQIHTTRRAVIRAILELNGLFIHFDRYGVSSFMRFTEAYTDYSYTEEETPLIEEQQEVIELVNRAISIKTIKTNNYTANDLILLSSAEETAIIDNPIYAVEADGHTYAFAETVKVRTEVYAIPEYADDRLYQYEIESDLPAVKDFEADVKAAAAEIGTLTVDKQEDLLAVIDAYAESVHMVNGEITVSYISEISYTETVDGEETGTDVYTATNTLRSVYERYIGYDELNPVYIADNSTPDTVSDLLLFTEKEGEITLENPVYEVVTGGHTYAWNEKITTTTAIYELPYYNKDYDCIYGIISDLPALKTDEAAIKALATAVGTLTTDRQAEVLALIDAFEEKVEITPEDNTRVKVSYISGISYVQTVDGVETDSNAYTVQAPLRQITGYTFIDENITVTRLTYQIPDYFAGNDYTPHIDNSKDGVIEAEDDVRDEVLTYGTLLRDLQTTALATIDGVEITEEITINDDGTFTVAYISQLETVTRHGEDITRDAVNFENPYTGYDARIYHGARISSEECMSLYINDKSNRAFDGIKILKSSEKTSAELGLYPFYWNNTAAEDVSEDMPEIGKWEGNNYYVIEDNFFISNFIFTEEQLVTVCQKLYERIDNFRYFNLRAKFKALPWTEVGDALIISTPENRYNTALLRRTMSGDLSMVDTIETEFYDD